MVTRQIDAVAELQNSFSVLFKNWVLAVPTALVSVIAAILLFVVFAASLAPLMTGGMMTNPSDPTAGLAVLRGALPAFSIFGIVLVVLMLLAQAVVIGGAEHVWHGQAADLIAGVNKAFAKLPPLLGLLLVAIVLACVCVALTIVVIGPFLGIVLAFFFMYALPAVVVGGEGTFSALGTSWRLVKENLGPSLIAFIGIIVVNILGAIIEALFSHLPVLNILINLVVGGLVAAYTALVVVRFYDLLSASAPPAAVVGPTV